MPVCKVEIVSEEIGCILIIQQKFRKFEFLYCAQWKNSIFGIFAGWWERNLSLFFNYFYFSICNQLLTSIQIYSGHIVTARRKRIIIVFTFFENLKVERKKMIFIGISSAWIFLNTWLFLFERGGGLLQLYYFWIVLILKLTSCIKQILALLPKITFFAFFSLFWRFNQWKNCAWLCI